MALAASHISASGASGTTIAVTSWTPTANAVAFLTIIMERSDGVTPAAPSSITGNGLTWTKVADLLADPAATFRRCGYLYAAPTGASPSTGGVTVNLGYTAVSRWNLDEVTGVDPTTPYTSNVVVSSLGAEGESGASSTTRTVTLAAFASGSNGTYACSVVAGTVTATPKTGWTELGDAGASNMSLNSQWIATPDTTPSVTYSSGPFGAKFVGVELSIASAGESITPSDSGTGTDSAVITVTWATTDSGTGADSTGLSAALSASETGAGTDQVGQSLQTSDSGLGSDTAAVAASLTGTDAGTGTDAYSLAVALTTTDSGTGTDTGTADSSGTEKAVTDEATGLDTATIAVTISVADSGQWFEKAHAYLVTKRTLLAVKTSPVGQMLRGGRRR